MCGSLSPTRRCLQPVAEFAGWFRSLQMLVKSVLGSGRGMHSLLCCTEQHLQEHPASPYTYCVLAMLCPRGITKPELMNSFGSLAMSLLQPWGVSRSRSPLAADPPCCARCPLSTQALVMWCPGLIVGLCLSFPFARHPERC